MPEFDLSSLLSDSATATVGGMSLALLVGFILSLLLKRHFTYFASTFSNRQEFSSIFPFLVLTVALVIAIVKSSLALSLGLVGALSIVRFRTPIKEPEELAYLFMAIAIGIGLGANQIAMTVVSTLIILTFMALVKLRTRTAPQNLFLSITNDESESEGVEAAADFDVEALGNQVASSVDECELRRIDVQGKAVQVVYFVAAKDVADVYRLIRNLRERYPAADISLIDQHRVPGV